MRHSLHFLLAAAFMVAACGGSPASQPTRTPLAPTEASAPPPDTAAPTVTQAPAAVAEVTAAPTIEPFEMCSQEVHDKYVTTGPDGKTYPTWHPAVDPETKCHFDHEHGDDPRLSIANSELPAFGYINSVAQEDHTNHEPHNGFKVFVVNKGTINDEKRIAAASTRIVAHMGTGGVARFDRQFHSLQFDLIADDGHYVHVQGMADTGQAGSICDRDRTTSDNDATNDIGRTVVTVPEAGCNISSLYEIWLFRLTVRNEKGEKATIIASTAVFDPITILDSTDHSKQIFTRDAFNLDNYHGCDREAYHGPVYWYNKDGDTVYYTDAMGNIVESGALRQEISAHADIGIPMNQDQTQMKLMSFSCSPGLGLSN
jgi:hypothetical protein